MADKLDEAFTLRQIDDRAHMREAERRCLFCAVKGDFQTAEKAAADAVRSYRMWLHNAIEAEKADKRQKAVRPHKKETEY